MTTTVQPTAATKRIPMDSLRKTALVAGALYLITFATSIPARILFGPVRNDPNYIVGPGADAQVLFAGFLDVMLALACFGTAVALYPVVKRQNQGVALGFVGSRVLEAAIIVSGVVSLLSVVTLRQAGAGADALVTGQALVAMYDWTFLFGPGFMACDQRPAAGLPDVPVRPGAADHPAGGADRSAPALCFRYRRAVRPLGTGFPAGGDRDVPVALWEVSLGVWLVVKGFNPSPITAGMTATDPARLRPR